MVGLLFLDQKLGNLMEGRELSSKRLGVRSDCGGCVSQFVMLVGSKMNRKLKLSAKGDKTSRQIGAIDGCGIPCI